MKDVFSVVTERIIAQLKKGIVPWRRTWSSVGPTSYLTNKEYQGINAIILQDVYKSPYWLTFRQAQKLGGSIKAGEKGSPIVFVDRIVREEMKADGSISVRIIPFLKYYTVFNWEQTRNLPEKVSVEQDNATIPNAEEMLRRRGPRISYHPSQPHYSPTDDTIYLPSLQQFESNAEYYSTAFHELTHWTGGQSRLARPEILNYRQEEDRSQEELTAEIGAAFLCKICALDTADTLQNSAAYIGSWLKVLKDNPRWILKASRQAREAVEFIQTGKLPATRVK
jgi:antirestriction protein ArdC